MEEIELLANENTIEQTDSFKYLGVKLNKTMEWSDHIDYIQSKVCQKIRTSETCETSYYSQVQINYVQHSDPTNFDLSG